MEKSINQSSTDDLGFSIGELRKAIPQQLFVKSEIRFLISLGYSLSFTLMLIYLGKLYLPISIWAFPLWIFYAAVTGTVATGLWVLAHECGHGAFSDNKILNDILGFVLHTLLLVPYFSWQHSHAVHHAKTNHMTEGETHVPYTKGSQSGLRKLARRNILGTESFSIMNSISLLTIGWPAYLLFGVTGGPARGFTSHFIVPNKLFPQKMLMKVGISNLGLCVVCYILYLWAQETSFNEVFALYIGPYLVVNSWLTLITYLQHTDQDVPHYDEAAWTWLKGALCTIDRNYPSYIDALHHNIGTTHVVHHIFSDLPHYNAKEANMYIKKVIGNKYKSDSKGILRTLFETEKLGVVENNGKGEWRFI